MYGRDSVGGCMCVGGCECLALCEFSVKIFFTPTPHGASAGCS